MKPVLILVGARPNFVKLAPLLSAFHLTDVPVKVVHTGQHYDSRMSDAFFHALKIPNPDYQLGIQARTRIAQTAEIIGKFEHVLIELQPRLVCVIGDVTSTAAGAIAAASCDIPVAHVEAGLRSFDRLMPEEINRILADSISQWFFVSEPAGVDNLLREGQPDSAIYLVGDLICDALRQHRELAHDKSEWTRFGLNPKEYGVVTVHRPSNVDAAIALAECISIVKDVSRRLPLVWPLHPRTNRSLRKHALLGELQNCKQLTIIEPLDYLEFLSLLIESRLVISDSGGIQLETTLLDVPCFTLRTTTERPMTVERGTNTLVGRDLPVVAKLASEVLMEEYKHADPPEYWDGRTANRIADILSRSELTTSIFVA